MKIRYLLFLVGLVLLSANLAMAGDLPGSAIGSFLQTFPPPLQPSSCVGNFGVGTGVCNIFEEPDNLEQQDFNLGSPNINVGLVDIYDPNGVTLSDSLDFYLNADGNVHLLFQSDGFAQSGGSFGGTEDAAGNWSYLSGVGNNLYMGVSPNDTPEPSSLVLLGSGLLGIAGVVRRRFL